MDSSTGAEGKVAQLEGEFEYRTRQKGKWIQDYKRNEAFQTLRRELYAAAMQHDAPEAAHALLYGTYAENPDWDAHRPEFPHLTASDYQTIIDEGDRLFWKTLQRSCFLETEVRMQTASYLAKLAAPNMAAFRTAVESWGTVINPQAPYHILRETKRQDKELRSAPSFAGYLSALRTEVVRKLDQFFGKSETGRPQLVSASQKTLDSFTLDGWHLENVSTWRGFANDYTKYCLGYNGFPNFGNSSKDEELREQDSLHLVRASYQGQKLFWIWMSSTYKRLRWSERVVNDEVRSLKRSLGGKIGIARRDAHILEDLED